MFKFENLVAMEMNNLIQKSQFELSKMAKSKKKCCNKCGESCKCDKDCPCRNNCSSDCSECYDMSKKSYADMFQMILTASEQFDSLGLEKVALSLLKTSNVLENEINNLNTDDSFAYDANLAEDEEDEEDEVEKSEKSIEDFEIDLTMQLPNAVNLLREYGSNDDKTLIKNVTPKMLAEMDTYYSKNFKLPPQIVKNLYKLYKKEIAEEKNVRRERAGIKAKPSLEEFRQMFSEKNWENLKQGLRQIDPSLSDEQILEEAYRRVHGNIPRQSSPRSPSTKSSGKPSAPARQMSSEKIKEILQESRKKRWDIPKTPKVFEGKSVKDVIELSEEELAQAPSRYLNFFRQSTEFLRELELLRELNYQDRDKRDPSFVRKIHEKFEGAFKKSQQKEFKKALEDDKSGVKYQNKAKYEEQYYEKNLLTDSIIELLKDTYEYRNEDIESKLEVAKKSRPRVWNDSRVQNAVREFADKLSTTPISYSEATGAGVPVGPTDLSKLEEIKIELASKGVFPLKYREQLINLINKHLRSPSKSLIENLNEAELQEFLKFENRIKNLPSEIQEKLRKEFAVKNEKSKSLKKLDAFKDLIIDFNDPVSDTSLDNISIYRKEIIDNIYIILKKSAIDFFDNKSYSYIQEEEKNLEKLINQYINKYLRTTPGRMQFAAELDSKSTAEKFYILKKEQSPLSWYDANYVNLKQIALQAFFDLLNGLSDQDLLDLFLNMAQQKFAIKYIPEWIEDKFQAKIYEILPEPLDVSEFLLTPTSLPSISEIEAQRSIKPPPEESKISDLIREEYKKVYDAAQKERMSSQNKEKLSPFEEVGERIKIEKEREKRLRQENEQRELKRRQEETEREIQEEIRIIEEQARSEAIEKRKKLEIKSELVRSSLDDDPGKNKELKQKYLNMLSNTSISEIKNNIMNDSELSENQKNKLKEIFSVGAYMPSAAAEQEKESLRQYEEDFERRQEIMRNEQIKEYEKYLEAVREREERESTEAAAGLPVEAMSIYKLNKNAFTNLQNKINKLYSFYTL